MSDYQLIAEQYVIPTPAGAYYAVSSDSKDLARQVLFGLMSGTTSQIVTIDLVQELTGLQSEQEMLELIYRMQKLGWIQSEEQEREGPVGMLEDILPELLSVLSGSGKALLADQQGFYLATHGFSHEAAEELSALSADIASLHQRHSGLLRNNLGIESSAWSVVDASGDSHLGCWPVFIGDQRFSLVLGGVPQMNQMALTDLVWTLTKRYRGASAEESREAGAM